MKNLLKFVCFTAFLFVFVGQSQAAKFEIDKSHSEVSFSVIHLGISKVSGTFNNFTSEVEFDPETANFTKLETVIEVSSIDTENERRDKHLRSSDFFDADFFPEITFVGKKFEKSGDNKFIITGELTIRDVTKTVKLEGEMLGMNKDKSRAGFVGSMKLIRQDYDLTWNQVNKMGEIVVSDEVTINLQIQIKKS